MYQYNNDGKKVQVQSQQNKPRENYRVSVGNSGGGSQSKSKKTLYIILGIFALLVVALLGFMIYRRNEKYGGNASTSSAGTSFGMCGGSHKQRFGFRFY